VEGSPGAWYNLMRLFKKKEEENPWDEKQRPEVTVEEAEEAIESMKKPKPPFPWWKLNAGFVILWGLGHFVLLFGMASSPIAAGILVYVLINLYIFMRYLLILGKVNRK